MTSGNGQAVRASILIVDDDAPTLRVMGRLLQSAGYAIEAAGTVAEARQRCSARTFDLVIADVRLPDGNGIDMLSRLKRVCAPKTIVVSGDREELHAHLGLDDAFNEYLTKPISFETLLEVVRRVLGN